MNIFVHVVFGGSGHLSVHGDVGLHPPILSEPDHPMDLDELHPMVQVELEVAIVDHIVLLGHEIGDQFEVLGASCAGLVVGDMDVGV